MPKQVPKIDTGDTTWMLISTALVMLMTPGLAIFYGGMVRKKNILVRAIMHSFISFGVITVIWIVYGYSLAFSPSTNGFIGGFDWIGLSGVGLEPNPNYAGTIPHQLFMLFQMMFAIISPALISGAIAERMKFTLDRDGIRANREELFGLVQEGQGQVERDAPAKLPGYVAALRLGFDKLDTAIREHGSAPGGQLRYSAETREAAKVAYEVEISLRRVLAERAGDSATARELKSEAGVGEALDAAAPMEVHDLGLRQIAALNKESYQKLLAERDVDHGRKLKQLVGAVGELKRQLDAGVGRGPKKGEATDDINEALLWLEVTFSRVIFFLDEYRAKEACAASKKRC